MEKGTAVFYHNHIQQNIARLDERKDKFVQHRLEFLKEYCLPIQLRIDSARKEIQRYKQMRDTQQEVIESQPDIASLKTEIQSYIHTRQYFSQKVNEYEHKSIEYEERNADLRRRWHTLKRGVKNQHEEIGFALPYLTKRRIASLQDQTESQSLQSQSFILPSLRRGNQTESILADSKVSSSHKKMVKIEEKIQRLKSHTHTQKSEIINNDSILEDAPNENRQQTDLRKKNLRRLRERMTQFDRSQTLFRECFEVKKTSVQRSVSQLQSKLITNREQFLNTCQAIGSRESTVQFEQFSKLSCDQILTLFISFVWLNKRLNSEFVAKRRLIMDFIGKLPKTW